MNAGKEIALLKHMTVTELRARYAEAFGEETRSRHKVFLVKRIAWRPGEAVTENNGRLALSVFDFSQNLAVFGAVRTSRLGGPSWSASVRTGCCRIQV